MSIMKFNVKAKSESKTKIVVETRGFKMTIDEPQNMGGTNEGANPVEYLLAALSGCLNVTGYLVAREIGFKLNGIELEIEGDLNPDKFMGKSSAERGGYKEIRVTLKPDSDADKDTLEDWINIVESRCPVSGNISNATPLKIVLG